MPESSPQIPDETNLQDDPLRYILYICCTLCCCGILMIMLPFMAAMLGMTGLTPDNLPQTGQYSSVDDCLTRRFGSKGQSGTCSYNGPNVSDASRTNIDTIVKFLSGKGLNKTQIAAIAGNFQQESGFSPTALNPSSQAYGLGQWLGSRYDSLVSYCQSTNQSIDSLQAQLEFFWKEFTGPAKCNIAYIDSSAYGEKYIDEKYDSLYDLYQTYTSIEDLVGAFHDLFECSEDRPPYANRVNYAKAIFDNITCSSSSSANQASTTDNNKVEINDITYFNQQDYNTIIKEWDAPISQLGCGITCAAMISSFVIEKDIEPDDYYSQYGAHHLTSMQNATGKKALTADEAWDFVNKKDENWEKIKNEVSKGNPVMIFTGYSGTHIILIVGYTLNTDNTIKEVIVNDPYNNFYDQNQRKAEHVYYPFDDFNKYLTQEKHSEGSKVYYLDFSRPSAVNSVPQYEQWMIDECEEILRNQTGSSGTGNLLASCDVPGITFDNGTYDHIYLHWSGGSYNNQPSDGYHITIDDKGKIYQNHQFSETTEHTASRNSKAIGICVLGMMGYKNTTDWQNGYGSPYPITDIQIETMAKVTAKIASHYKIPIDNIHVMTHAEAGSNKDFPKELVIESSPPNVTCLPCEGKNIDGDDVAHQDGLPTCNYGPTWDDGWPTGSNCRWDLLHHGDIIRNKAKQCISATNTSTSTGNVPHFCQQLYQDPQGNNINEGHDGCGPTSLLMILKSYGLATDQTVYSFYHDFEDSGGFGHNVNTNPSQLKAQAEKFTPSNTNICWHTGLSVEKIIQRAKEGKPTQVGTLYFRNKYHTTSSGHYVAIKGFTQINGKDALIASDSACWGDVSDNANEILFLDEHTGLDGETLPGFFDPSHWPDNNFVIYATPCS